MKKIFTNIAIAILFIGIFIPSSNANAQSPTNPGPGDIGTCTYPGPNQQPTPNLPYKICTDGGGTWTANPPSSQTTPTPEQDSGGDWLSSIFGGFYSAISKTLDVIFYGILWLMTWILWFAGTLLNYILDYTIVNMQKNISGLTGINIAWKIIRDLMNIVFIFLLVYEGIKLIIDQGDLKSLKNFIFGVVLASLLINFSLFFTKVLIDASNIVTVGIYTSITGQNTSGLNSGLSDPITTALGISSIFGDKAQADIFAGKRDLGPKLIMLFGSGIVILVTAFAFVAVSAMFVIRFVALILLMMTSPIAYMGMAIPAMKSYSKEWWESLKGQLLFAPIFMIMMLISLTLMTSNGFIVQGDFASLLSTSAKPDFSTMGLMLNFAVIIGLIFGSIITAKKTASSGSRHIGIATKYLTKKAGDVTAGTLGWSGRKSFGYIGNRLSNNASLQDAANRDRTGEGWRSSLAGGAARAGLYASQTARSATFDVRNASIPTSVVSDTIRGTVGRTRGGKFLGLNDVEFENISVGAPISDAAGTGTGTKNGYKENKAESEKRIQERESAAKTENALVQAQAAAIKGSDDKKASPTDIEAMEKSLTKMSDKQTEALVASNRELLDSQNFANAISVKQLDAINKSDKFTDDEKKRLNDNRFKSLSIVKDSALIAQYDAAMLLAPGARSTAQDKIIKDMDKERKKLSKLNISEIEKLDPTLLEDENIIAQLKGGQVEKINDSSQFTTTQKDKIKTERMKPLKTAISNGDVVATKKAVKSLSIKEVAGLDMAELGTRTFLESVSPQILDRMRPEMSASNVSDLRTIILGMPQPISAQINTLQDWLQNKPAGQNFE